MSSCDTTFCPARPKVDTRRRGVGVGRIHKSKMTSYNPFDQFDLPAETRTPSPPPSPPSIPGGLSNPCYVPWLTDEQKKANRGNELAFILITMPWSKKTFAWYAMKRAYIDDPSKFTLYGSGHYSGDDTDPHLTIKWESSSTYSTKFHIYFKMTEDGRKRFTHITTMDAFRSPFAVAAMDC